MTDNKGPPFHSCLTRRDFRTETTFRHYCDYSAFLSFLAFFLSFLFTDCIAFHLSLTLDETFCSWVPRRINFIQPHRRLDCYVVLLRRNKEFVLPVPFNSQRIATVFPPHRDAPVISVALCRRISILAKAKASNKSPPVFLHRSCAYLWAVRGLERVSLIAFSPRAKK